MARDDDEEPPWSKQLLVGVGVLVAVALVIGGVVSVVALGAARVSGIDSARARVTAAPSLYFPSLEPTTSPEPFPDPGGTQTKAVPSPAAGSTSAAPKKKKAAVISLQVFPRQVPANGRINLTGVYPNGEGARLQVQRFERRWVDFPVSTSVTGGLFNTYVFSGRVGANRFRVVDTGSGRASNPVRVRIG